MKIDTYLLFDGHCEEALNFYRQALGGEIDMLMRYRDSPDPPPPGTILPSMEDKVMHANLRLADGTSLMAADNCMQQDTGFQGFQLSLSVADASEAERCFNALAAGGKIKMALGKTFFSPCFGMLSDRFGVSWMLIVPAPMPPA